MSAKNIERSETVYALGFPGVSDSINDAGDILPSTVEDITITRGIVSKTKCAERGRELYPERLHNQWRELRRAAADGGRDLHRNQHLFRHGRSLHFRLDLYRLCSGRFEGSGRAVYRGRTGVKRRPETSAIAASGSISGQSDNSGNIGGLSTVSIIVIAAVLVLLMIFVRIYG
jgi:hypothetical protein